MNTSKRMITVVSITLVVSLAIGIAIGNSLGKGKMSSSDNNNNGVAVLKDVNWNEKTPEELGASLSEVMLPEDEFTNLQDAIYKTGVGLLMAQAQSAGITATDQAQQELKKSVEEKYSRKYFSETNAGSLQELSKPELITVLSFYNTEAGQKFLKLSPKMIKETMSKVQADLSAWLPKEIDTIVAKLKGGDVKNPNEPKGEPANKGQKDAEDGKADS